MTDQQAVITAVNNDEKDVQLWIPLPFQVKECIDLLTGEKIAIENGKHSAQLEPCGAKIWRINGEITKTKDERNDRMLFDRRVGHAMWGIAGDRLIN